MRVAVLGAYGAVGRRLVAEARSRGHTVTAVGRDETKLAGVEADDLVRLGVQDRERLAGLARRQDVLVNTTGVEDPGLAAAVTHGGSAFMEISATGGYLERLRRLGSPRRPILAGTGLAPGLTNLLAVTVPPGGPLHIGVVAGIGEQHGTAAREWIWHSAGGAVSSSGTTERVYRTAGRFAMPCFGRRTLLRAGFGEQDQLSVDLGRPVSTWLGLDPAWATPLLGIAGAIPRAARLLDRFSGPFAACLSGHDRWAVVVTDATSPVAWATGRRETDATAIVAALCLEPLRAAEPGAYAAHQLVELEGLRADLADAGIDVGTALVTPGR